MAGAQLGGSRTPRRTQEPRTILGTEVAWSSFPVHAASSVAAELEAAAGAHSFVVAWLSGQDVEKAVREHLAWQYMA